MLICSETRCAEPVLHAKLCRRHLNEKLSRPPAKRTYDSPETREARKLAQYGIGPADYWLMFEQQGGVCAICQQPERTPNRALAVDHDHQTGAVRGLLCGNCNRALGFMGDSPDLLDSAAGYLREHGR